MNVGNDIPELEIAVIRLISELSNKIKWKAEDESDARCWFGL